MRMDSERQVSTGSPLIEFRRVDKFFNKPEEGQYQVVGDLNIQVRENEFLVLFGPGQCGKSTILNMVAGFEMPSSGELLCQGKPIEGPGPERGMVFQNTALFPWLTVMGNVEYGPKVRGEKKESRQKKAQHYIDLVGLQGLKTPTGSKLSGGMQQRWACRAYCNEPLLMLLDEPFGHLDAQTRYLMQDELTRIWQAEKRTVIFVTNNIEEAVYLAVPVFWCCATAPPASRRNMRHAAPSQKLHRSGVFAAAQRDRRRCGPHAVKEALALAKKDVKVRVEHLTKKFGDLLVLDDLNFEVEEGEFLCIVGPTGCGKTTFLNSLTRLYEPTAAIFWSTGFPWIPKSRIFPTFFRSIPRFPG